MQKFMILIAFFVCVPSTLVFSDDSADVAALKKENELLNAKLEAANLKIEKLQKQLDELKSNEKKPPKEKDEDLIQPGTSWSGTRNYQPSNEFQDLKLVVLTRDGSKFTGEIHFKSIDNKQQQLAISGNATQTSKGPVNFKTEQKGIFQQQFTGTLAGGQISFTFNGDKVQGTGNLKQ
jgi:hypothetical protein